MANNIPLTETFFYILLSLREPKHGYGIIQEVSELTNGRVHLGPGTLYGAINSMLSKGWIILHSEEKASRKKKEYRITENGRRIFKEEIVRLNELITNSELINQ